MEKKGVYLANSLQPIIKRNQDKNFSGNLEAGTEVRPLRNSIYWLSFHGLLDLLSYTTEAQLPRDGTTSSGQDPPTVSINQNIPHRYSHKPI